MEGSTLACQWVVQGRMELRQCPKGMGSSWQYTWQR